MWHIHKNTHFFTRFGTKIHLFFPQIHFFTLFNQESSHKTTKEEMGMKKTSPDFIASPHANPLRDRAILLEFFRKNAFNTERFMGSLKLIAKRIKFISQLKHIQIHRWQINYRLKTKINTKNYGAH